MLNAEIESISIQLLTNKLLTNKIVKIYSMSIVVGAEPLFLGVLEP